MKHLGIDVFGKGPVASLEAKETKDSVAPQPTVSIYIPGVDDTYTGHLQNSLWGGYNIAIQRIHSPGGVAVGMEGTQQMSHDVNKNATAQAIIQLDESKLDDATHEHDYSLFMVDRTMEQEMAEVIRTGRVSGVYLVEPRDAYGKEFIDLLDRELGTHVYTTIGDAERGVERYRATGK